MRRIYLLTTQHLEECLWFRDDEDYKVAMNYIAIQAACCPLCPICAEAYALFLLSQWSLSHSRTGSS